MILAPTELSATAPLKVQARRHGFRAATMPGFGPPMIPALRLDYTEVNRRCVALKVLLDEAIGAQVELTADGRAVNDPRVEPRPVGVVEIVTSHPPLFSDHVAPAVVPSGRPAPRASNDPRGPRVPEAPMAEAAG